MDFPEITQERIEQALTALELNFERDEDDDICVYFNNCKFFFFTGASNNLLLGMGYWRGAAVDPQDQEALLQAVNEINNIIPFGGVSSRLLEQDGQPVMNTRTRHAYMLAEGVSDEQLQAMLSAFFEVSHATFARLEDEFPQLVSWNEEEN